MQYSSDINPSTAAEPERIPWYNVWIDVTTSPSRATFRRILADPTASPVRAYLWVGLLYFLIAVLEVLANQWFGGSLTGPALPALKGPTLLCVGIAAPVIGVAGFMLSTGILHFIARLFGGTGKYDDLAYCFGAVHVSLSIFTSLIAILNGVLSGSSMPVVTVLQLVLVLVSFSIGIYQLFLTVLAVAEAENLTNGKATLVVLLPVIIAFALGICLAVFTLSTIATQLPNLQ